MSLNVLKWVYNLGVKHERHRIASYLQSAQLQHRNAHRDLLDKFQYNRDISKKEETFDERVAMVVNGRVSELIETIFHGHDKIVSTESVMFPEEEK